jgi:hypothetical protein
VIEIFAGKYSRHEILWEIPLVQLNQLIHAHLHREGNACRRRVSIDALDKEFDALCATYAR